MTGLEKLAIFGIASATSAQVTIGSASSLFSMGWTVIGAVLGMGVSYGMMRQRLASLEAAHERLENAQEKLATKESVGALHEKLDTVVRILDSRTHERRQ